MWDLCDLWVSADLQRRNCYMKGNKHFTLNCILLAKLLKGFFCTFQSYRLLHFSYPCLGILCLIKLKTITFKIWFKTIYWLICTLAKSDLKINCYSSKSLKVNKQLLYKNTWIRCNIEKSKNTFSIFGWFSYAIAFLCVLGYKLYPIQKSGKLYFVFS